MTTAYTSGDRRRLMVLFEKRAPRYGRPPARRSRKKADAVLAHPVPLEALATLLRGLSRTDYAIIGGHAVTIHGHARNTEDVDLLVRAEEADDVAAALGGEMIGPLAIGGTSVRAKGVTVDLVAPDRPWVEDALATARQSPYGKVVSKPFLVLMKLCAMRGEQDDTDVIYVLKKMTPRERRETRALVSRHLPSERDDFDLMVRLAAG